MNSKFYKRTTAGIMSLALLLGTGVLSPDIKKVSAAGGSVTINEICAKNSQKAASDGGFYDWIELYNSSGSSVDISGWGLTDKAAKPYKFKFADGTSVPAGGRILIFCDSTAGASNTAIAPFSLSTGGETVTLSDKDGNAVSTVTFGAIAADVSYGQYPDGSGEFFTLPCTPDQPNAAPEGSNAVKLPEFSAESGFYSSEFDLTITAPEGTTVVYTLDGSDPTADSEKYTAPIHIKDMSESENVLSARTDISASQVTAPREKVDKAMIVRAAAVDANGNVSEAVTKTYFLGKTNDNSYYKNMKVISLVTDPDNLFDYEKGIYVKGKVYDEKNGSQTTPGQPGQPGQPGDDQPGIPGWGDFGGFGNWGGGGGWGFGFVNPWEMEANYTQKGREWERIASFEMFEDGKSVLQQNVGIRIKGAASRSSAQKSFNVYARADYGKEELEFDFFDGKAVKETNGKKITKFDSIVLRNGGNDAGYGTFRDCINQQLVYDRDFAAQHTNECIVFIDGEYWGMYQLTEKVSDDYLKNHYNIKKSNAVIIKNNELEEGSNEDLSDWNSLVQLCSTQDMSNSANYEQFKQKVDVQSYIDYFAAQIYWCNWDWPQNNFSVWRAAEIDESNQYADGKWRMFLFDTEYATGLYGRNETASTTDPFQRIKSNTDNDSKMFINLLKNDEFKKQFELTFMDLANYNFDTEKTEAVINYYKEKYIKQASDTYSRFFASPQGGQSGDQKFTSELSAVSNFYKQRFEPVTGFVKKVLGLTDTLYTINLSNDGNKGTVKLNTLTFDEANLDWSGKYFGDYEVNLKAVPKTGYTFDHWEIDGKNVSSADTTVKLDNNITVKAVYKQGDSPVLKGDVNSDGTVNDSDVALLQKYLLGEKVSITDADINGDGLVDVFDLSALRKICLDK